jgi:hypothetical protein
MDFVDEVFEVNKCLQLYLRLFLFLKIDFSNWGTPLMVCIGWNQSDDLSLSIQSTNELLILRKELGEKGTGGQGDSTVSSSQVR